MFRKTASKSNAPVEEEISEDLLANVPELDSGGDAGAFSGFPHSTPSDATPFTLVDEEPAAADTLIPPVPPAPRRNGRGPSAPSPAEEPILTPPPPMSAPPVFSPPAAAPPFAADADPLGLALDVHGLVDQTRASVASAFQQELGRVEESFGSYLAQMEARLAQAELELSAVQAEHDQVKAATDRKADALRDLKRALESV